MGEKCSGGQTVNYIHLLVTAEGPTEQIFAEECLGEYLLPFGVIVRSRSVLTSRDKKISRQYRGGLKSYSRARGDLWTWMKEERQGDRRFTTMFDCYGLPKDFPDYKTAMSLQDPYDRVFALEQAFAIDVSHCHFIPYIQLHEFEALILADPGKLRSEYLHREQSILSLTRLASDSNPELINDHYDTVPSRRIQAVLPEYDKVMAGPAVAKQIGIPRLKERCRHFCEWVQGLERLNPEWR